MKRLANILVVTLSVVAAGTALLFFPQKNANGAARVMAASAPPVVCRPVHGTIHSVFTQNCTSRMGLCTAGTISDAGILDGATTFIAFGLAPFASMPGVEPPANLSYSGQLTISASNGTLITHDLGALDVNHLAFTEIDLFPAQGYLRIQEAAFSSYRDPLLTTRMDFRATSPSPFAPAAAN